MQQDVQGHPGRSAGHERHASRSELRFRAQPPEAVRGRCHHYRSDGGCVAGVQRSASLTRGAAGSRTRDAAGPGTRGVAGSGGGKAATSCLHWHWAPGVRPLRRPTRVCGGAGQSSTRVCLTAYGAAPIHRRSFLAESPRHARTQQPESSEGPRQELPRRAPARAGLRDQQEEPADEGPPGLNRLFGRALAGNRPPRCMVLP